MDFIQTPTLPYLVSKFLLKRFCPNYTEYGLGVLGDLTRNNEIVIYRISVFHSATCELPSISDPSGRNSVRREKLRANPRWRGFKRYDCVLINEDPCKPGLDGMHVARVHMFFSFMHNDVEYQCALVHWFIRSFDNPDHLTGMWVVEPEYNSDQTPSLSVVHIDTIVRSVHLIPAFQQHEVPHGLHHWQSLNVYDMYYVNKYADLNIHELLHQ